MGKFLHRLSLVPKGLRYKLMIAFSLMSVIPLLVCGYIATNYVFPHERDIGDISLIIVVSVLVALFGLGIAKQIITPVIDMALEAKLIASGDFGREVSVKAEDEVGDIARSLNIISHKIRDNINELRTFGEKTREINIEIQEKVFILSALLEIGNLIASESELDGIFKLILNRLTLVANTRSAFLMLQDNASGELAMRATHNLPDEGLKDFRTKPLDWPIYKMAASGKEVIVDSRNSSDKRFDEPRARFGLNNLVLLSVHSRGEMIGLLGLGNTVSNFSYKDSDIEIMKVFSKQVSIAIENVVLLHKAEALSIKDELTGLFNEKYIRARLDEEIKRAILYQRPCSFVLLNVDNFSKFHEAQGAIASEAALRRIASLLLQDLGEVDRPARFSGDEFAIILPERSKKEAISIADKVRRHIEEANFSERSGAARAKLTLSAGVSENPLDGNSAEALIRRAMEFLDAAKAQGKNRVTGG